jgi:hypothetical protein
LSVTRNNKTSRLRAIVTRAHGSRKSRHYGGGPSAVHRGTGYTDVKQSSSIGSIVSLFSILIWLAIGSFWWHALGLF